MKFWIAAALSLSATGALAIVGGREETSPLTARTLMVLSSNGGVCSAVIVAQDAILTAGHCAAGGAQHRVHYRDGQGQPVLLEPAARSVHPGYEAKAIETRRRSIDLALIRLAEPLPRRFAPATLSGGKPAKDLTLVVSGYGVSREGEARTTGTFRSAPVLAVEPYGPSSILLWVQGKGAGACQGDFGGRISANDAVVAITSWSTGDQARGCGGLTQGILLGPQRAWIDRILSGWKRQAAWQ